MMHITQFICLVWNRKIIFKNIYFLLEQYFTRNIYDNYFYSWFSITILYLKIIVKRNNTMEGALGKKWDNIHSELFIALEKQKENLMLYNFSFLIWFFFFFFFLQLTVSDNISYSTTWKFLYFFSIFFKDQWWKKISSNFFLMILIFIRRKKKKIFLTFRIIMFLSK